jgi:hypothetical protein
MRRTVTEGEMLNSACRVLADNRREIRWLKKQVRDLLAVADNLVYADANGDWDVLDAACRGARRMMGRRKTIRAVGYEQ